MKVKHWLLMGSCIWFAGFGLPAQTHQTVYKTPSITVPDGSRLEYLFANKSAVRSRPLLNLPYGVQLRLEPLWFFGSYNSSFPYGPNLQDLWAGRGFNTISKTGFTVEWGPLQLGLLPAFSAAQNAEFELMEPIYATTGGYVNPGHRNIDFPQRMGEKSLANLTPGESFIRLTLGSFSTGFGWEPMWLGPGKDMALLLSNNAPAFPHFDIGLDSMVTPLGGMEARLFWGCLERSPWAVDYAWPDDFPEHQEQRLLTGLVLGYSPAFIPGLTLGFGRIFYSYLDSVLTVDQLFSPIVQRFSRIFRQSEGDTDGQDNQDQLLGVSFGWAFPVVGFELWGEFGRNDSSDYHRDFMGMPEHSRAFLLGVRQHLFWPEAWRFSVLAEIVELGRSGTRTVRPTPPWYVHHIIREGATQQGQLLGAWIGPGSNSQLLALDAYYEDMRFGLYFRRVGWDMDTFYKQWDGQTGTFLFVDTRLHAGLDASVRIWQFDLSGGIDFLYNLNRYYSNPDYERGLFGNEHDTLNINIYLSIRWVPAW